MAKARRHSEYSTDRSKKSDGRSKGNSIDRSSDRSATSTEQPQYWTGKENQHSAERLKAGETIILVGFGQSMVPILKSGQPALVAPVTETTPLDKNDVVFTKVNGHFYLHKIAAVKNGNTYLISNNHGHANGWVSRSKIYGKMIARL